MKTTAAVLSALMIACGAPAMARFDQMIPVSRSTLSLWIIFSAICTASSGF